MSKKIITKINEFLNQNPDDDLIIEMARISGNDFPYLIYVYGGNSYGAGRNEHGEPHFHFMDKINNGKFKLSIKIPHKQEWSLIKDLIILSDDSSQINWNGLKKEKNMLIEWLDKSHHELHMLSNIIYIVSQWNTLNSENKNVKLIKDWF